MTISSFKDLTDAEWAAVRPWIPEPQRRPDGRGRPWRDGREILNGILYVIRTGSTWADLPGCYPPYQTCHRRFRRWLQEGVIEDVLAVLGAGQPAESSQSPDANQSKRTLRARVALYTSHESRTVESVSIQWPPTGTLDEIGDTTEPESSGNLLKK
jgi:transposase